MGGEVQPSTWYNTQGGPQGAGCHRGVTTVTAPLCHAAHEVGGSVKMVVGLGNPGARYAHTRHNVGFDTVDLLAQREGWSWSGRRSHAVLAEGLLGGQKVLLVKPQTYMNDSGLAVGELVRFYKLDLADLLVVCDDLDLPLGRLRLRARGAAGGQHGLESIIRHLGGNTGFARLRIGVGRPRAGRDQNVDFLLSRPATDERIVLEEARERGAEAVRAVITEGIAVAMNRFNADASAAGEAKEAKAAQDGPASDAAS
jgi:peptidyl-tRNA hydrolase, PTH1 family